MIGDVPNALQVAAWKFTLVANAKRQLAPPWSTGLVVAAGDAVMIGGQDPVLYVCPAGGTTGATSAATPTGRGSVTTSDGLTWIGYSSAGWKMLTVVDDSASGEAYVGDVNVQSAPVPPNDGSAAQVFPNPLTVYAISAATPTINVVAYA